MLVHRETNTYSKYFLLNIILFLEHIIYMLIQANDCALIRRYTITTKYNFSQYKKEIYRVNFTLYTSVVCKTVIVFIHSVYE